MAKISEVPGITGATLELFEASGFDEARNLLLMRVPEILAKLQEVNQTYHLAERLPSQTAILAWQKAARILERSESPHPGPRGSGLAATLVTEEELEAAGIDLDAVPIAGVFAPEEAGKAREAERGAEERLHEAGFDLREPPEGEGEEEPGPEPDVNEEAPKSPPEPTAERSGGSGLKGLEPVPQALQEDDPPPTPAPVRPVAPETGGESENPSGPIPVAKDVDEKSQRTRLPDASEHFRRHQVVASEEGADADEDPPPLAEQSRFRSVEERQAKSKGGQRRNRGMSHPKALRVWVGAGVTLAVSALSALTLVGLIFGLLMALGTGWEMPRWMLYTVGVFPVCLVLYLFLGSRPRCRLCGQKLFVPKHCRPHVEGRRSVFGYTLAMAWDIFFRLSFRCMYCGTKTRLRK